MARGWTRPVGPRHNRSVRPLLLQLSSVLAVCLVVSGCAGHPTGGGSSDSQIIAADVARTQALLDSLDACTADETSAAVPIETIDPAAGEQGAYLGRLGLAESICTRKDCPGRACCNGCDNRLSLGGMSGGSGPSLMEPGDEDRFWFGATDCSIQAIIKLLNEVRAVAQGRFEKRGGNLELVVQRLCRVEGQSEGP
jgi:hypothetical protein